MLCKECSRDNLDRATFSENCGNNLKNEYKTDGNFVKPKIDGNNCGSLNDLVEMKNIQENKNREINLDNNFSNSLSLYCRCGQKLENNWKFCPNCKNPITVEIKNFSSVEESGSFKEGNAGICISLFIIGVASAFFLKFYWGLLISVITIITGKIKFPNNRAIKVLFWLTIIGCILYVVFIMWLMFLCNSAIKSCSM